MSFLAEMTNYELCNNQSHITTTIIAATIFFSPKCEVSERRALALSKTITQRNNKCMHDLERVNEHGGTHEWQQMEPACPGECMSHTYRGLGFPTHTQQQLWNSLSDDMHSQCH